MNDMEKRIKLLETQVRGLLNKIDKKTNEDEFYNYENVLELLDYFWHHNLAYGIKLRNKAGQVRLLYLLEDADGTSTAIDETGVE